MTLEELLGFDGQLEIADIGAAAIAETPPYRPLLDRHIARLKTFDADPRQHEQIKTAFGPSVALFTDIVGDGKQATLYLTDAATGMSSILAPSEPHQSFFNGFRAFGLVNGTETVQTTRLDDVAGLPALDFLKMDIQGSELAALMGGPRVLGACVAIQLEVSFVPLYRDQPGFGEIDVWMRRNGFLPHTFTALKRWSVNPVIRQGQFRYGYNQLLEGDIVYFRDVVGNPSLDDLQLKKLALIAHYCYRSADIAGRLVVLLSERGTLPNNAIASYLELWGAESGEAAYVLGVNG